MKERPILFSAPMVRALLDESKTQTRRVIKPQPSEHHWQTLAGYRLNVGEPYKTLDGLMCVRFDHVIPQNRTWDKAGHALCPHGAPGDRLWVREAFRFPSSLDKLSPVEVGEKALDAGYSNPWAPTLYEADNARTSTWSSFHTPPTDTTPGRLRAGMHMPRWAGRITLAVTGVRVERLNAISDADALAEGVERSDADVSMVRGALVNGSMHCDRYARLWDAINGEGAWAANPWVWVVEFRRLG